MSRDYTEGVRLQRLQTDKELPLVVLPDGDGIDLEAWVKLNRQYLEQQLPKHGGILFRNFGIDAEMEFERLIEATGGDLLEYKDGATPRKRVSGNIYTSTNYPPSQVIELHNENSYSYTWPMRIFFFCATAPGSGGETPLADSRRVYRRISPATVERFERLGLMYVRNFGRDLGVPWEVAFNTSDREAVEAYCRRTNVNFEWKDGHRLRTWQVRPAVVRHPETGETVWFNQATAFHLSTLPPLVHEALVSEFGEEGVPKNVFYGDGSSIEPAVLEEIREAYREETVIFSWREGDVLMLDNMLTAHGRRPYAGPRRVLVGMTGPFSRDYL